MQLVEVELQDAKNTLSETDFPSSCDGFISESFFCAIFGVTIQNIIPRLPVYIVMVREGSANNASQASFFLFFLTSS